MDGLLSFHLLKIGGLLVFDDNDGFPGVAAATSAFLEALSEQRLEVMLNTVKSEYCCLCIAVGDSFSRHIGLFRFDPKQAVIVHCPSFGHSLH